MLKFVVLLVSTLSKSIFDIFCKKIFRHPPILLPIFCFLILIFLPVDILDDMLAGVGWTMQDYLKHGENDYYPPLPNGHRLFLHDIRRVAVRCAVAMGEEGDMVVSSQTLCCLVSLALRNQFLIQLF